MSVRVNLSGEWGVVTGASSGIGREFARQLASEGCNLMIISNDADGLNACGSELAGKYGIDVFARCIDLTGEHAVNKVMDEVEVLPRTPILLINDAGIFDFKRVATLTEQRVEQYIDLHVRTLTLLTVRLGVLMGAHGGGYILNMSSMSCWMPMPGIALYSATKAYVRAFSRAIRVEMLQTGVKVMVACPGGIATDLFGLPRRLQRIGTAVGALAKPERFVRKALRRLFRGDAQYVNGWLNRLAIVGVSVTPECIRRMIVKRFLIDG